MDDYDAAAAAWSAGVADPDPAPVAGGPVDDLDPIPPAPDLDVAPAGQDTEPDGGPGAEVVGDEVDLTVTDDGVHGNPAAWTLGWFFQQVDGYCGPAAVAQVVSQYTGIEITGPEQLVERAVALGLMDDPAAGMTLPGIESLLEDQGVPASITTSSLDDLRDRLDAGYGVIAMVDSGEIWQPDLEQGEDDRPDHVLVVAGIDDTRGVVILSDPGTPFGNQLEIPIDQFENAWADSGFQMLVTDTVDDALATPAGLTRLITTPADRSAIITL